MTTKKNIITICKRKSFEEICEKKRIRMMIKKKKRSQIGEGKKEFVNFRMPLFSLCCII
jgi:hypothetical protein